MLKDHRIWILFALMVIAQLAIPALMIKGQEDVLRHGKEFRFKTAPVDPYDLMRGKYITLRFEQDNVNSKTPWSGGEIAFVTLAKDEQGYAILSEAFRKAPTTGEDYLELELNQYQYNQTGKIYFELPFNRYYMEESKAQEAENIYRESRDSPDNESYALVMIKDGQAVLKDVLIDNVPIKEAVEAVRSDLDP